MKSSIALVGFMGARKTTVGRVLARKLKRQLVELDSLIEMKSGKSVIEIFQQDGEIVFRELEIEVTKQVAENKNFVIACGGGIVLNKINIDRLRKECVIVYLTASPEVIIKRTLGGEDRPLLNVADRTSEIRELLKFREPFYERAADITVDTSKLDVGTIAEQIRTKLKKHESFRF